MPQDYSDPALTLHELENSDDFRVVSTCTALGITRQIARKE
jgi:hypothetical protein